MVTVAVVAVLLGIAAPSFYETIKNNRLRTLADRLVTSFNLARSEAVKRNIEVIVCPSSDGLICSGNYSDGWLIVADLDGDGSLVAGSTDPVLRVDEGLPEGYTVTGTDGTSDYTTNITYYADGSANDPQAPALYLCPPDKDADAAWRILVSVVGRSVTSKGSDGGNYSCPG
jgi:type IV fimbrial biogenesis protein FimT